MPNTTHRRSAALGKVARLLLAAERHGQAMVDADALRLALEDLDIEGLATPRPAQVGGVGRRISVEQARASLDGERVSL
jgi:hypothetical protein